MVATRTSLGLVRTTPPQRLSQSRAGASKPRVSGANWQTLFRPVESRNTFEETIERLEQAIALGAVRPGTRLPPERQLVELLNVSRATLREAIRVLQQAGYVESIRGRTGGTVVIARSQVKGKDGRRLVREMGEELFDLLDQRRVLEPGAAELAAERASPDELVPLYALYDEEMADRGTEFQRIHPQIHLGIAALSKSPALVNAIAQVHYRLSDVIAAVRLAQATIAHADLSHKRVLDAIAAHDGAAARSLMADHVLVTDRFLRSFAKG